MFVIKQHPLLLQGVLMKLHQTLDSNMWSLELEATPTGCWKAGAPPFNPEERSTREPRGKLTII